MLASEFFNERVRLRAQGSSLLGIQLSMTQETRLRIEPVSRHSTSTSLTTVKISKAALPSQDEQNYQTKKTEVITPLPSPARNLQESNLMSQRAVNTGALSAACSLTTLEVVNVSETSLQVELIDRRIVPIKPSLRLVKMRRIVILSL